MRKKSTRNVYLLKIYWVREIQHIIADNIDKTGPLDVDDQLMVEIKDRVLSGYITPDQSIGLRIKARKWLGQTERSVANKLRKALV